ncbi:MAG: TraR/DksA C4-type zinc finger protein [Myxococcales bacterium]|nr:TraR/DksA C4-type zinc finger protein [Myxococcota bacterium]MDW8283995.1 TraR/DksA C4-type zinc finger protein [Myxococcales bacterium]
MTPPPTEAQIQYLKRRLLRKGAEINARLVELLADPTLDLSDLVGGGAPGERPQERLRRFMALIDDRLRAIREGRYGRCDRCGDGLPFAHLEQVPWSNLCRACAQREAEGAPPPLASE